MNLNPQAQAARLNLRRPAVKVRNDDSRFNVGSAARFLARRRWLILVTASVVAAAASGFLISQPRKYAATAVVLMAPPPEASIAGLPSEGKSGATLTKSELSAFRSPSLVGALVDKLKLAGDSYWNDTTFSRRMWPRLAALFNLAPEGKINPEVARQDLIQRVTAALQVSRRGSSYVLDITATSNDSGQAAQIANTAVQLYLDAQIAKRFAESRSANDWVSQRLAALQSELVQLQAKIDDLRFEQKLRGDGEAGENEAVRLSIVALEREAAAVKSEHLGLQAQYQKLIDASPNLIPGATVISEALEPATSISVDAHTLVGFGLAIGVLCGLAVGLVRDVMDAGIKNSADASRKTGRPTLASIPLLNSKSLASTSPSRSPAAYVLDKPMSAFAESLRNLRAATVYTAEGSPPKTLSVTSARPGEGKTTASLGLARVAALSGQNVLLIDCDLRRRDLTKLLDLEPEIGLIDVVAGKVHWRDAIVGEQETGLKILPSAESFFLPKDTFGSVGMARLLSELRANFDLVLLDGPSALGAADAGTIAAQVDQTILVARWNKTPENIVRRAIRVLVDAGGFVPGVVLNFVNPRSVGKLSPADTAYQANFKSRYYAS